MLGIFHLVIETVENGYNLDIYKNFFSDMVHEASIYNFARGLKDQNLPKFSSNVPLLEAYPDEHVPTSDRREIIESYVINEEHNKNNKGFEENIK